MGWAAGILTYPYTWVTDRNNTVKITASRMDAQFAAVKEAADTILPRDGSAPAAANIPMGGFKITGLGNATGDAEALNRQTADARYLLKAQLAAGMPVNASITCSVGSSELTVALKGADGTDPSATNTVLLPFRSATAGTGTITTRSVTAATSITINSTALLGTTNGTAFSLWVVAFDDAGTIRLGVINCLSALDIYALQQQGIASSTAEDNAADSAHVFYTGTAVSSKPYLVLGRLIWNSGLVTAGTWNAVADVVVNMAPGVKLPGQMVQSVISQDGAVATGTTTTPIDDTIPQNTEGNQFMTLSTSPTVSANLLCISHAGVYSYSGATDAYICVALFQDSTAGALAAALGARSATANAVGEPAILHVMRAGTTSSTTFKIRAGVASAGTITFNGSAGARLFGGGLKSYLRVEEIVA